jgi:ribosomal-protein-alanine N-acetyltransferase
VARALLDEVLADAAAEGVDWVLLEVSAVNAAALAFYARTDFVEIDRRRRYYRDGSDAVVMRRSLGRIRCGGRG